VLPGEMGAGKLPSPPSDSFFGGAFGGKCARGLARPAMIAYSKGFFASAFGRQAVKSS
jgi:hypothetical protein